MTLGPDIALAYQGDDPETVAFSDAMRATYIAAAKQIRWTGAVIVDDEHVIAAVAGLRPDVPHARRIFALHERSVAETGEGLNVGWQWAGAWCGHRAVDCWISLVLRYPTARGGLQFGFNAMFDRPLLNAIIAAEGFAWTLAPWFTMDTAVKAIACDAEAYKLAQILAEVDHRATLAESSAPTRRLRTLRARSRTRRSHRPTGPGGLGPKGRRR